MLSSPLCMLTGLVAISGLVTESTARIQYRRATNTIDHVTETSVTVSSTSAACASATYQLQDAPIDIDDTQTQDFELKANCGLTWNISSLADVTSWFVDCKNQSIFGQSSNVAQVATVNGNLLTIQLDASKITSFSTNGPGTLTIRPPSRALRTTGKTTYIPTSVVVGSYKIPKLNIMSDIRGSAYTHAKSTLKEMFGIDVEYYAGTSAKFFLDLPGLDDARINSDNATITLTDGDGYYTSEYNLTSNKLADSWLNGWTEYSLNKGDLVINTGDYLITDSDSGREWSCLGGNGQGQYLFNLQVAGITYNGLPVTPETFPVQVYIYGYNYTADALTKYGEGTIIVPVMEPLSDKISNPPQRGSSVEYTWVGLGNKPNLGDAFADDVYITWPVGTDASNLEACDVQIVLHSVHGATFTLMAGRDFVLSTSSGETQIAVILQNWPFEPVYPTMSITVNGDRLKGTKPSLASLTKNYDIASMFVYLAQQGGGGTTVDGTVTAYSFYGFENLDNVSQIAEPANYTLGTTVKGVEKYYAEDSNGTGVLVNSSSAATVYDGSGVDDMNIQLIGNTLYITTRVNATATETIKDEAVTFTKSYSGGATLSPDVADPSLTGQPGYAINRTNTWIFHEKWAWQPSIKVGWGGIYIEPYTGKFEWTMTKGSSQLFTADVPSVNWTLFGNITSPDTKITSAGNLTIAIDETAEAIAVIATSTTDKSYGGKGTVNVEVTD
ncbi:uncharacterized protein N7483_000862 [Penicillium malachiteum]|uniref:uncharacterized protein n=1 Tax=Penicillium malachiteum TaxID=1324776 RepID=UPI002548E877|nr:uncharacterized protein N7483_000862 [Penicillium malachiteum]KAJ5735737.1 hypothetical protein N7483_000862 [Penicillium malachiteum]